MEILDTIRIKFTLEGILKKLRLDKRFSTEIRDVLEKANEVARPKALYTISYVENRGYNTVDINGIMFTSRVLRINLDTVERVFPYIITCGKELDSIVFNDDYLKNYCMDTIKHIALKASRIYLKKYLKEQYQIKKLSSMNPGSGNIDLWPIEQQKNLFSIFGNPEDLIGVTLTKDYLMIPTKSISGIFLADIKFENCQLCERINCPSRRAEYDEELMKKYME